MTAQEWMRIRGYDRVLKDITDDLLTVYLVDEKTGLCAGKVVPDAPMQKDWQIWEDEHRVVYFDRLDPDARMWVKTIIKETGQEIPMECKYDPWNKIYRFMEEGASYTPDNMYFSGFNTISFSFRKGDKT